MFFSSPSLTPSKEKEIEMFKEPKAISSFLDPSEGDSPESLLEKKQAFLRLGVEAKEVLRTLIQMPEEFLGIDRDRLAYVRRNKVVATFRKKKRWSTRTIERAFRQIAEFWSLF